VILTTADGGRIVLQGLLAASGGTIEQIQFDDGTVWAKAELIQKTATAQLRANDAPIAHDDGRYDLRAGTVIIDDAAFLDNDTDFEGDTLKITALSNVTPGITASLDGKGHVIITSVVGFTGDAGFTYTVSDGQGSSTAHADLHIKANRAPVASGSIANQTATAGQAFAAQLPTGLFSDPDNDRLYVSAKLADGSALPSWLHFNAATGLLSGTPPTTAFGSLAVQIIASDGGMSAQHAFTLTIENAGIASVLVGTNRRDTLRGTEGNDQIEGKGGADTLIGNGGDDVFVINGTVNGFDRFLGGDGTDTIRGSSGNDIIGVARTRGSLSGIEVIDGGDGTDVLAIGPRPQRGAFTLDLTNIQLTSIELIKGSSGNDRIFGSGGRDTIFGGGGNDTLTGNGGDDVFLFSGNGGGFDRIDGGDGFDRILGSTGDDTIGLRGLTAASGVEAIDGGTGRDVLMLTSGNDILDLSSIAVSNVELIAGGKGHDKLTGSAGNDRISGGRGNDVFVFAGAFGHDQITDFVPITARLAVANLAPKLASRIDHDRIDLSAFHLLSYDAVLALTSNTSEGALIAFDANTSILLEGLRVADLRASDFIL
jgi:Ca2+-binding RTX toxin-like protein